MHVSPFFPDSPHGIRRQTQSVTLPEDGVKSNPKCVDSHVPVVNTVRMRNPTQKFSAQLLFASNVRRLRLERNLTQELLAEGAGLHTNYISSVERGQRNISIGNIERIACALGVTMAELLTEPDKPRKTHAK